MVIPSDLAGMRALWNVALEAENAVVLDQATRLLNRTHQVGSLGRSGWMPERVSRTGYGRFV